MLQIKLGNSDLIATSMVRSIANPSMVKVTFNDGSEAGVSISAKKMHKYWNVDGDNLTPKFLTSEGKFITNLFRVTSIDGGQPVILEADSNKPLKY